MPQVTLALEASASVSGFLGLTFKFISCKLHAKIRRHEAIRILAISKLNTISDLISKALDDNQITDEEFKMISSELT